MDEPTTEPTAEPTAEPREPVTVTRASFTGTVGPVRFTAGRASTADPGMLAYFRERPELYDVLDAPTDPDRGDLTARQVAALERGMPPRLVALIDQDDERED